jgi:hypothetical protein
MGCSGLKGFRWGVLLRRRFAGGGALSELDRFPNKTQKFLVTVMDDSVWSGEVGSYTKVVHPDSAGETFVYFGMLTFSSPPPFQD